MSISEDNLIFYAYLSKAFLHIVSVRYVKLWQLVKQAFVIFLIEVSINYKFCMVILEMIKHYLGRKMNLWEVLFLILLTFYDAFLNLFLEYHSSGMRMWCISFYPVSM